MLLKCFIFLTIFRKKFRSVLRYSSQWLSYMFYQVKELISCKYSGRTLGNIQGNFSTEGSVVKCIPINFLCLIISTGDKDHAKIL